MANKMLSVIIPCYNEENTIEKLVGRVFNADRIGLDLEVIIIDDGSSDSSAEKINKMAENHDEIQLNKHPINRGKGAALRTGFALSKGDIVLVQDADLEYDPLEYPRLLEPIVNGEADVVFGSRFIGGDSHRVLYFWHYLGNPTNGYTNTTSTNAFIFSIIVSSCNCCIT